MRALRSVQLKSVRAINNIGAFAHPEEKPNDDSSVRLDGAEATSGA